MAVENGHFSKLCAKTTQQSVRSCTVSNRYLATTNEKNKTFYVCCSFSNLERANRRDYNLCLVTCDNILLAWIYDWLKILAPLRQRLILFIHSPSVTMFNFSSRKSSSESSSHFNQDLPSFTLPHISL
jgi:hypothetical protein